MNTRRDPGTPGAYDHPGVLLPYSRRSAGARHASPRRDTRFTETLHAAPALVLVPTFRSIGDSLFVLTFLEAFAAYRTLDHELPTHVLLPGSTRGLLSHLRVPEAVTVDWFDDQDLYTEGLGTDHQGAVLVTDGRFHIPPGAESHRIDTTHAYPPRYIEHDPASGETRIHSSLTARYALWFEELVGVVLPLDPPHAHARLVFTTRPRTSGAPSDKVHVAVVATASSPAKDYGAAGHLRALGATLSQDAIGIVTAHVILPPGATGHLAPADTPVHVRVVPHPDLSLARAAELMAWCDLTIGNDTGMTELAAISYRSPEAAAHKAAYAAPPVIAVFGRYDHDMWSISPRIHPVPSATSAHMTRHNRAHVLTAEEWDQWGASADASAIHPARLADTIRAALRGSTTAAASGSRGHLVDAVVQLRHRKPPPPAHLPDDSTEHAEITELVTALFDLNSSNWTLEDQVRERYDDLSEVGRLKRIIDGHNRTRHRLIELLDDRILAAVSMTDTAPLSLETPGMLIDRLTVLAIRLWHLATPADSDSDQGRHVAEQQWRDLITGLERLIDNLATGTVRFHVYRALKTYGSEARSQPAHLSP